MHYFCNMVELERHIEWLLQDNDCVIIPGFGGFIAHYTPAQRVNGENRFLPPTRIIGFNPLLKLNDGLLVQSYMAVHKIDFAKAAPKVTADVNELIIRLQETGKVRIGNIGEIRLSIQGTLSFVPSERKLSSPALYGLASFEMHELKDIKQPVAPQKLTPAPAMPRTRRFAFRMRSSYLVNAAAMIAIIALFFFLPTPIENTEITEENYAQLLPGDLFEKLEKQSLAITPIIVKKDKSGAVAHVSRPAHNTQTASQQKKKKTMPVAVKEVKVKQMQPKTKPQQTSEVQKVVVQSPSVAPQPAPANKPYHIIVASVGTEKDARAMADQLIGQGHTGAKAIIGNGKMRVCIESYATESEAYKYVNTLRKQEAYKNAWVLKQ